LGFHDEKKNNGLFINYIFSEKTDHPEDQMLSFHSELVPYKNARFMVEGALGLKGDAPDNKIGKAFWAEMTGRHRWLNYRMNIIRSNPTYPGYYQGIDFNSATLSIAPVKMIELSGSYHEQKRNMEDTPASSSFYARNYNYGCSLNILKGLQVFGQVRNRKRCNYSESTPYDYEDRTIRFGINTHFGPFLFMASMDRGKTDNRLLNQTSGLNEYIGTLSFQPSSKFSLNGYAQWRDQEEDFTGDGLQNLTLSFDTQITIGRTSLYALYRTSFHREFYDHILNDFFIAQQLITNKMSLAEISLRHQFKNRHSIGFHIRQVLSPFHPEALKNIAGVIDYTIPINFPVSKKLNRCELSGQIYDPEKDNKGIRGVIIRANDRTTITDNNGRYTFHGLESGQYYLTVERASLHSDKITAEKFPMEIGLSSHKKNKIDIPVVSKATIYGRVHVYDGGQYDLSMTADSFRPTQKELTFENGLANVMIEINDDSEIRRQMTDTDGQFQFEDVRPGDWVVKTYPLNMPENHYFEKDHLSLTILPGSATEILFKVIPVKRRIQFKDPGANQEITIVSDRNEKTMSVPNYETSSKYTVQVGSFAKRKNAENLKKRLGLKFKTVYITQYPYQQKTYFRVRIGTLSYSRAQEIKKALEKEGHSSLIIREF
jgi:hypothetical protein